MFVQKHLILRVGNKLSSKKDDIIYLWKANQTQMIHTSPKPARRYYKVPQREHMQGKFMWDN